jgi:hypothetical protein
MESGGGGGGGGGGANLYNPRTVEEVFRDFKGRRTAMIKALTTGRSHLQLNPLLSFSLFFSIYYFSIAE